MLQSSKVVSSEECPDAHTGEDASKIPVCSINCSVVIAVGGPILVEVLELGKFLTFGLRD